MTMQLDDDTLQRYYDGDLSPVDERAVRTRVEGDADAQKRLAQLAQLSDLFRMASEDAAAGLDSEALFASITADVEKQQQLGTFERLRLVSSEWLQHKRTVIVPLVATTAVAAAALLTVLVPQRHKGARDEDLAEAPSEAAAGSPQAATSPHGSRVEGVDFGANTGTVFEIDNEGVSTAVVWITDEEEVTP
jgi:hypothetical protein